MSCLTYSVESIPDLSLSKYQLIAAGDADGVLSRHDGFLRQWHGICSELDLSMHLLYVYDPSGVEGHRLSCSFILQGENSSLAIADRLIRSTPLSPFFPFNRVSLPDVRFSAGATLTKKERLDELYIPLSETVKICHSVPRWTGEADARLLEMLMTMQTISETVSMKKSCSCAYRIDLYPRSNAAEAKSSLAPILKLLRGDLDIHLTEDFRRQKGTSLSGEVQKLYEDWVREIETTTFFRANIYAFGPDEYCARLILNAAAAESVQDGNYFIAPIGKSDEMGFSCVERMGDGPRSYCLHSNHAPLKSWSTTFCLDEISSMFRFPVLYEGESIEIPKETDSNLLRDGLSLGRDSFGHEVGMPIGKLAKHAFFTGMPGSGKTNTMLHLVTELHRCGIPFLVLEPAKKEYRELLLRREMSDVSLYSPHVQSHFPLQINPFEFPSGIRVGEHIDALLEVFEGSFFLEGPTRHFLGNAISRAYEEKGWDVEELLGDGEDRDFPTLSDVYSKIKEEIDKSSYDAEIKGNVQSFLQVRLGSLLERDAGELFDAVSSTVRPSDWIRVSAIIELESLGEQARNFFILLVCHLISESLRADPSGSPEKDVRHALFIEEAHNVIASDSTQSSSTEVDPKVSSTAYIVKMLAEVRALREAIIIADQLPTALAPEVTKNTGLKIAHRLASQDDRESIGCAMSASPLQLEQIGNLGVGEAFLHYEGLKKPLRVRVSKWEKPDAGGIDFSSDPELFDYLFEHRDISCLVDLSLSNWLHREALPILCDIDCLYNELLDADARFDLSACMASLKRRSKIAERHFEQRRTLWRCSELDLFVPEEAKSIFDSIEERTSKLEGWLKE